MTSYLREKDIENYLISRSKTVLNAYCPKYASPGRRSVPDRLVLWDWYGHMVFVECKRPGEKLTPPQQREKLKLERFGQLVFMVDTKESVDKLLGILILL